MTDKFIDICGALQDIAVKHPLKTSDLHLLGNGTITLINPPPGGHLMHYPTKFHVGVDWGKGCKPLEEPRNITPEDFD